MAPRICIPPTSRTAKASTTTMRSSRPSSAILEPSCASLASTFNSQTHLYSPSFQRWRHRRFNFAVHRPPSHDHLVRHAGRRVHSAMDPSLGFQHARCWRILRAIRRTGSVGRHPHTARGDEPARISRYLPWRCVPTRERTWPPSPVTVFIAGATDRHTLSMIDDIGGIRADRGDRR